MSAAPLIRAVALLAALTLAGCEDPYAHDRADAPGTQADHRPATPSDINQPAPVSELPPEVELDGSGASPPRETTRAFASRWVNWSWKTAAHQQRSLARLADGELARQLLANAQSARIDATLARDKPGSRGTVAAVQLKVRAARAAGIVVTREQTLTDDHPNLGGQRYRVYAIRLVRDRHRWEVNAWTPQP
jgi:hypothetical protein